LEEGLPFTVYTVGTEMQSPITRLEGFSAHQLLLTFSGTGKFRLLGQDEWDIINQGTLLYIPAGLPNEYMPIGEKPWFVGYVTYVEKPEGMLSNWGFGRETFSHALQNADRFHPLLRQIWSKSGPNPDAWAATQALFSMFLELKKQISSSNPHRQTALSGSASRFRDSAVDSAVRFMHDHLERKMTMAELSAHVGYSPKQLTRLFRQSLQKTPLQYLQWSRLRTASLLLQEHPDMTIRQAAAYVGLEPVYFTRLFRRTYGLTPSDSRIR
jgi:AraC-like DNA-binding protein